jgi:glucose-6-phosphate 1-dehydrogenase
MATEPHSEPTVVVIFGAGGDLTRRKLVPALYNLFLDKWLPERSVILGVDRKPLGDERFRYELRQGVDQFSRRGKAEDEAWNAFAGRLSYQTADFGDRGAYAQLAERLSAQDQAWKTVGNRIFYLATPPTLVERIVERLGGAGLANDRRQTRLVAEKPFGRDLASAQALNQSLARIFAEPQIYRIDHYLGKETVQNILAFRFANSLFEPIWDRRYIDNVQITVAEQIGVGHRGGYYDHAGALRDMVQNHLLQILCLIAMEPPVSFEADEIRNRKVDVLRAIRSVPPDRVSTISVRGQYGPGQIESQPAAGYRQEPDVAADSATETFVALKLFIDNWRWQDVPFYLRTGKRLPARVSEVSVQFRPVPHRSFPATALLNWQPNRLAVRIQPDEGMLLRFQAKQPGPTLHLRPVDMRFSYQEAFQTPAPEAYETLLLDVMLGDATLFMRADQVEAAWSVVDPILKSWEALPPPDFPNYSAGTWGPKEAEALLAADGKEWLLPTILEPASGETSAPGERRGVSPPVRERGGVSPPVTTNNPLT